MSHKYDVSTTITKPEDRIWILSVNVCLICSSVILDLVDLEGQVKNLPSSTEEYASEYVTGRETYILIRVDSKFSLSDRHSSSFFFFFFFFFVFFFVTHYGGSTPVLLLLLWRRMVFLIVSS